MFGTAIRAVNLKYGLVTSDKQGRERLSVTRSTLNVQKEGAKLPTDSADKADISLA